MTLPSGPQPETRSAVISDPSGAETERALKHLATRRICPFLTIEGGAWRSANPSRDHRCGAVTPPVPLAPDKQRRLCLEDAHLACATYLAATGSSPIGEWGIVEPQPPGRPGGGATPTVTRWSLVRTVPVVLDRSRVPVSVGAIARDRRSGQLLLAALLVAAFAAVAYARLSGSGGPVDLGGQIGIASPSPTAAPTATPLASAVVVLTEPPPTPSPIPSVEPTPPPSVAPTEAPTPPPSAAPTASQTYRVQSGDTLERIAKRFGTTVDAIVELNGIQDRNRLYVGQVLKIP